jgi:hypothetical protein
MASLKRQLVGGLLLAALLTMLPLIVAQAQCPDSIIYVGGPLTDDNAVRGSQANAAADMNEAYQICLTHCLDGAYVYQYNAQEEYHRVGDCGPEAEEPTGVPLAQPVVMGLLGVIAVGAIVWGTYLRLRLKRMTEGR